MRKGRSSNLGVADKEELVGQTFASQHIKRPLILSSRSQLQRRQFADMPMALSLSFGISLVAATPMFPDSMVI